MLQVPFKASEAIREKHLHLKVSEEKPRTLPAETPEIQLEHGYLLMTCDEDTCVTLIKHCLSTVNLKLAPLSP